ncbi:hypothetical protein NQ317_007731 [Molorchus minor]|uniref:Uncharacterized protein n=1 Tax=Molorchus minor TaxID=1323400 RepID=A0ABQ9JUP1_9CUCU|nr:hypothetical protein NQ317_007731 [Molorchus minor]
MNKSTSPFMEREESSSTEGSFKWIDAGRTPSSLTLVKNITSTRNDCTGNILLYRTDCAWIEIRNIKFNITHLDDD